MNFAKVLDEVRRFMEARDLRFGADPERGGPSLDLERGLVTTDEDVAALRRARAAAQRMSMAEYLDFLASFPDEDPARLRLRRGPGGSEPFTL